MALYNRIDRRSRSRSAASPTAAAASAFDGQGSCGNGAAMRVAPLGAYFVGDPARVAREAELSAEIAHPHPEGIAGAVAVALAAGPGITARDLLGAVLGQMAESQVGQGIAKAAGLLGCATAEAAYQLGNGARVTAQDTVPFTLWVAATRIDDYAAAITACVEAGGNHFRAGNRGYFLEKSFGGGSECVRIDLGSAAVRILHL
ncbi:ADP-ribosylglycohydrolase family protein [Allokutzneria oryzae]|uniref:ADP-ribosylglycohydrolase family protein n=1 Tax=Allokutzneria oryzae TaxID=1378989 RepID=A0ABV5ZNS3_9PSEU